MAFSAFLSQIEPNKIKEALKDTNYVNTMEEELHQFERLKDWHLVPRFIDRTTVGTK